MSDQRQHRTGGCFCHSTVARQDRHRSQRDAFLLARRPQDRIRGLAQRLGITREAVWIQHSPDGDVAVVHLEADDLKPSINRHGQLGGSVRPLASSAGS